MAKKKVSLFSSKIIFFRQLGMHSLLNSCMSNIIHCEIKYAFATKPITKQSTQIQYTINKDCHVLKKITHKKQMRQIMCEKASMLIYSPTVIDIRKQLCTLFTLSGKYLNLNKK